MRRFCGSMNYGEEPTVKTKKWLYYFLMLLPLAATLIALPLLPDRIPAHYGMDNQVDRWGSKYEALLVPAFTLLFGLIMLAAARCAARQEKKGNDSGQPSNTNNEKVTLITGLCVLLLFNLMSFYFLYTDLHQVENLSELPIDIISLVFACLGLLLIVCGNLMPKVKNNSIIGLRTKWSRKNEITWKKSQKFGGITFIISGILILAVSLTSKAGTCLLWSMLILAADAAVSIWYSWLMAKKYG